MRRRLTKPPSSSITFEPNNKWLTWPRFKLHTTNKQTDSCDRAILPAEVVTAPLIHRWDSPLTSSHPLYLDPRPTIPDSGFQWWEVGITTVAEEAFHLPACFQAYPAAALV